MYLLWRWNQASTVTRVPVFLPIGRYVSFFSVTFHSNVTLTSHNCLCFLGATHFLFLEWNRRMGSWRPVATTRHALVSSCNQKHGLFLVILSIRFLKSMGSDRTSRLKFIRCDYKNLVLFSCDILCVNGFSFLKHMYMWFTDHTDFLFTNKFKPAF